MAFTGMDLMMRVQNIERELASIIGEDPDDMNMYKMERLRNVLNWDEIRKRTDLSDDFKRYFKEQLHLEPVAV